jgi:hypothetical protein
MITLQIPVLPETSAEEVLEAIGGQLAEALQVVKAQSESSDDPELDFDDQVEERFDETAEGFSDETRGDLLAKLGYVPGE